MSRPEDEPIVKAKLTTSLDSNVPRFKMRYIPTAKTSSSVPTIAAIIDDDDDADDADDEEEKDGSDSDSDSVPPPARDACVVRVEMEGG